MRAAAARRTLADAHLQDLQPAILHREFDVAEIAIVPLQLPQDPAKLVEGGGHMLSHGGERLARAKTGNDLLALRVGQEVAIDLVRTSGRIARKSDAGAR